MDKYKFKIMMFVEKIKNCITTKRSIDIDNIYAEIEMLQTKEDEDEKIIDLTILRRNRMEEENNFNKRLVEERRRIESNYEIKCIEKKISKVNSEDKKEDHKFEKDNGKSKNTSYGISIFESIINLILKLGITIMLFSLIPNLSYSISEFFNFNLFIVACIVFFINLFLIVLAWVSIKI